MSHCVKDKTELEAESAEENKTYDMSDSLADLGEDVDNSPYVVPIDDSKLLNADFTELDSDLKAALDSNTSEAALNADFRALDTNVSFEIDDYIITMPNKSTERFTFYIIGAVGVHNPEDAGVNVMFVEDEEICANTNEILKLSARARLYDNKHKKFIAYELRPRSSIGKTTLVLQNSPGTMDAGYQGVVRAALFNLSNFDSAFVKKDESLVQITHPGLKPFNVEFVDENHFAFAVKTERGDGGFGSTGK